MGGFTRSQAFFDSNPETVFVSLLLCIRFEYLFNFDNTFEIHDDIEVLKRMGMAFGLEKGQCTHGDLERARCMVPKALDQYVLGKLVICLMSIA